jgi:hypothetical protein
VALNQVWDENGKIIFEEEVPDVVTPTDIKAEAVLEIESATTIAGLKAAMLKYVTAE